jgi:hypothetical protein
MTRKLSLCVFSKPIQCSDKVNLGLRTLLTLWRVCSEIKGKEELVLLTKAIRISAMGQREIMKAMHVGMSESEIKVFMNLSIKIWQ